MIFFHFVLLNSTTACQSFAGNVQRFPTIWGLPKIKILTKIWDLATQREAQAFCYNSSNNCAFSKRLALKVSQDRREVFPRNLVDYFQK